MFMCELCPIYFGKVSREQEEKIMRISWRSRKHCCRYEKAKEQFKEETKTLQEIFDYTKECLMSLGLDTTKMKTINDIKMISFCGLG